jgi:hypothetical protein
MVPVVAGEDASPIGQLLSVADFGSALSTMVTPGTEMGMINVDVNVSIYRTPVGPWFYLDAIGRVSDEGIGLAVTNLSDSSGPLGVVTQSQIGLPYPTQGVTRPS